MFGLVFVLSTFAFAGDIPVSTANAGPRSVVKAAKMHATGKVVEISNESIKIERTLKGDVETMAFDLEKPSTGIVINDAVKIEYTEKDGKLTASRVTKVTFKKKRY
jgi:hypothetical protein